MKRRNLFLFAAAALSLSFAACTKDGDGVETGHREVITSEMTTSYAKVKICESGGATGTRSDFDDPQFDFGKNEEVTINTISLVLYDNANKVVGTGAQEFTGEGIQGGNDNYNAYYEYVFKLSLTEGEAVPTKVVAFINMEADTTSDLNVDEPETLTADKITKQLTDSKVLAMTNSGYFDESGTYVVGAPMVQTYPSVEAAREGASATIYVERLAAKVLVYEKVDANVISTSTVKDIAGKTLKLTFNRRGWGATGTAKEMHQIKKQFDYSTSNLGDSWKNYLTGHRSFWAESVYYGDKGYADYLPGSDGSTLLKYLSFAETTTQLNQDNGSTIHPIYANNYNYVPEHTYNYDAIKGAKDFTPLIPSTSIIIIGNYTLEGENADWFKDENKEGHYDFYLLESAGENGTEYVMYNKSQLIAHILKLNHISTFYVGEFFDHWYYRPEPNKYGYKKSYDDSGEILDIYPDEDQMFDWKEADLTKVFDIKKNAEGRYVLSYKNDQNGNPIYIYIGPECCDGDRIAEEDIQKSTSGASHYNHGFSYFYQPIKHNLEKEGETGFYGVVRNHEYVLTVNKYDGIGAPLDEDKTDENEDEPIIPEPDKVDEQYMDANIYVLSWHRINQDVEF